MMKNNNTNNHLEILQKCRKLETISPDAPQEIISYLNMLEYTLNGRIERAAVPESRRDLHNVFKFPGRQV